jgi:hypothetical protein
VKAPVFVPSDELDLNEQKDIDFEAKSCGFIGLSRVSIAKNSHGSSGMDRDDSRDKNIAEIDINSSKSSRATPVNNLEQAPEYLVIPEG